MHFPLSFCKNASPYFFDGAFAPSFIWSRRPWLYVFVLSLTGVVVISAKEVKFSSALVSLLARLCKNYTRPIFHILGGKVDVSQGRIS